MDQASVSRRQLANQYLVLYNLSCAILWLAVFGRVILLVPLVGTQHVYGGVGNFAKWTQTVALLEVLHSAFGLVRSPLLTTLMQVSSRILLVWPVVNGHPRVTAPSPAYSSMLLAWSITEIIRYSYFVTNLRGGVPSLLTWLRYNTFYVLYPVGIASEMLLIFKASEIAKKTWQWVYLGILLAYIPGLHSSFSHIISTICPY
ncbi:hypothetical protein MMC22_010248 [Lobaria immixta]|nr:hypothetical protein [Lobaria immixta]